MWAFSFFFMEWGGLWKLCSMFWLLKETILYGGRVLTLELALLDRTIVCLLCDHSKIT